MKKAKILEILQESVKAPLENKACSIVAELLSNQGSESGLICTNCPLNKIEGISIDAAVCGEEENLKYVIEDIQNAPMALFGKKIEHIQNYIHDSYLNSRNKLE